MATREFNGTSDFLTLGAAGSTPQVGATSWLCLIKPLVTGTLGTFVTIARTTGNNSLFEMLDGAGAGILAHYNESDGRVSGLAGVTATDWQILGVSKPAGTSIFPRLHRSIVGSGSWTHVDATVNMGSVPSDTWTKTYIGCRNGTTNFKNFRIAVAALFSSELSDANYQSVTGSTQQIANLGPIALWEFNQASVATTVTDLIGTANETARTGTTAVADDPAWTYGLSGGGGGTSLGSRMLLTGVG